MDIHETVPLLFVRTIGAFVTYFRDGLGFQVTEDWSPDGQLAWCRLQWGGTAAPQAAFYGMNQTFLSDPDGYALCFESRIG